MVMHRIHQLATDWGVSSKDIIDRLEKMGIRGKKAQSGLSEADAERVREEMGLGGAKGPAVIVRRTVEVREGQGAAVTAVDTITETHVKRGVLLRRTQRTTLERAAGAAPFVSRTPGLRVATAVDIAPDVLSTLDRNEFAYAAALPGTAEVSAPEPEPRRSRGSSCQHCPTLLLLLTPVLLSSDIYVYAMRGQILSVHHQNPYLVPASNFPEDPFLGLTDPAWRGLTQNYGPLWTLFSALLTWIGGARLFGTIFLLNCRDSSATRWGCGWSPDWPGTGTRKRGGRSSRSTR